jgi:hypothetical protein
MHKLEDVSHLQTMVVIQLERTAGRIGRKGPVEIKVGTTPSFSLFFTHFLSSFQPFYNVKFF